MRWSMRSWARWLTAISVRTSRRAIRQWKGAASDKFLKYAVDRVTARGGRIANLEVTLICERPKIGPLRDAMRAKISEISGVALSASR